MKWRIPPKEKVYEALTAIASGRVQLNKNGTQAKVHSSSGHKFYTVRYDTTTNAVSSNDNSSFWTGQIGYPVMAFLLASGVISYDKTVAQWLADIPWKDINTKHKNNWAAAVEEVLMQIEHERDADIPKIHHEISRIYTELKQLKLNKLLDNRRPPAGY